MTLKRKYYSGKSYQRTLSIEELRRVAKKTVPNFSFEYVEGGSESERTLQWNSRALDEIKLVPNTLIDTSSRHQRTSLFGQEINSPLVIAPTGLNGMLSKRGDVALARAAARLGIPFSLSTLSNVSLEEVAKESGGKLWMQLYVMTDRELTRNIIQRADKAGYDALVFTSDANVFGQREWDQRNYREPAKLDFRNMLDVARHPRWIFNILVPDGIPKFENIFDRMPPEARTAQGGIAFVPKLFDAKISWEDVKWLRDIWPRKLIIKGILNAADAKHALHLGCDGIVVSNHGGRQLDSAVAPIEVLPEIIESVGSKLTVLVDNGFRRGTDIIKAIAMGADAVMIGRPTLYGLAAGGEAGVNHALSILTTEIDRVLGQTGCRSIDDVGPHLLR
ncbi:MAG: alpha-hydroxy-acid oxidizing protein [Proteobacteria bacterium]|nr:alpha-hydroxy-acid oxidizing protein [Pseudomonadota bacterium]NOG60541.1 alpha-hydroxy-acid oxidizing protein [Pseudomonadota bacterium]